MEFEVALYVSPLSHSFVPKVTKGGMAPSSRLRQVWQAGKGLMVESDFVVMLIVQRW